jgi:hypothetical protein
MRFSHAARLVFMALALGACGYGNADPYADGGLDDGATTSRPDTGPPVPYDAGAPNLGDDGGSAFTLRAEWTGPCQAASGAVDVNLGNSPEAFVTAAFCQINGSEPSTSVISNWANQLRTVSYVRRIDVVRTLCQQAGKTCSLQYSDPWLNDPPLTKTCARSGSRDVGAVLMFFFGCPGQNNCGMDWANTHAFGMSGPSPIYGFGAADQGYYNPSNAGFWLRELLDARYAGLQFMMPNVYGFDIQPSTGEAQNLESALTTLDGMGGGVQVGLFNDTWAWGEAAGGTLMNPAPSLSDTATAAQRIYDVEWKPFFTAVSKPHWYLVNGQPLIYFYNAGTLSPVSGASAVIAQMKQMFQSDFGVTPFVVVDRGYGNTASADAMFTWDTFTGDPSTHFGTATSTSGGLVFDSSMVKWDSLGRDDPGAIATSTTRIFKGTDILTQVLSASTSASYLLLETWNDLGEGTGITRNYDYYANGSWLPPSAFFDAIRASQCTN